MRVLKRSRAKTPTISIKTELINDNEPTDDAKQVAAKDVNDNVIPPALLEVIQHISQRKFNHLKRYRCEHDQLQVTTDQGLEKPAQKMSQGEEIETSVV